MTPAPGRAGDIAIGVPVRNEVTRLPRLLAALAGQQRAPCFTVCLFFDNCDDGSAELAQRLAADLPFAIVSDCCHAGGPPNAGAARRRAMALAMAHAHDGVLLTTDADSTPPPDWLAANLAALRSADIVAGRITCRDAAHHRIAAYFDRLHALRRRIDPVAWEALRTHHWTSGASLAFRAPAYRALGGFPARAHGEDAALIDAAARAGFRTRRDADIIVCTSSRRRGRADHGFAAGLATLDSAAQMPDVSHPEDEAWRFRHHARARALHGVGDRRGLAAALGLPLHEVEQVARECANGEAFAARIVGAPPGGMRSISLAHAELLLAALEQGELVGAA